MCKCTNEVKILRWVNELKMCVEWIHRPNLCLFYFTFFVWKIVVKHLFLYTIHKIITYKWLPWRPLADVADDDDDDDDGNDVVVVVAGDSTGNDVEE